jgi:hypothetical protein
MHAVSGDAARLHVHRAAHNSGATDGDGAGTGGGGGGIDVFSENVLVHPHQRAVKAGMVKKGQGAEGAVGADDDPPLQRRDHPPPVLYPLTRCKVSGWVCGKIVQQLEAGARVGMISFFIRYRLYFLKLILVSVAQCLMDLQNFNGVSEIVSLPFP